ncbi:MAG: cupin domain-containing protein [Gammaproteobacteria bacterium]|jgi:quercetin dioxygenase-like cupin family protein|nr:cupin domain-containing protein [Gammaproteobacteria bacterium]
MQVVRFKDAKPYVAPKHYDMSCVRLQGVEASDAKTCWVGFSTFQPGGGAEMDATPLEKIYVVLSGEITITTEDESVTLQPKDSCVIPPDEARSVANNSDDLATMLVIMPYAKGK